MNSYKLLLVISCALLISCVTTTTGVGFPASKEEAARLNRDLGISYLRQGDLELARGSLEKSIDGDPDNATTHLALGMVYERLDYPQGAEKEYRRAVRLAPEDADALNQLGSFVCLQGDVKEALSYFDRAIEVPLYQSRYLVYTNAGTCAKKIDLERAENYLRKGLASNATFPDTLYQLGDVAYRREYYLQARAFIERCLAVAPATPDVLWLGYRNELAMNDMAAAEGLSKQLLNKFPESVEARLLLDSQRDAR